MKRRHNTVAASTIALAAIACANDRGRPDSELHDASTDAEHVYVGDVCLVRRPESCNGDDDDCDGTTDESPDTLCTRPDDVCVGGECVVGECEPGLGDCDGDPETGCEQRLDALEHCSACGTACAIPNATATCRAGTCAMLACDPAYCDADRNVDNGCEVAMSPRWEELTPAATPPEERSAALMVYDAEEDRLVVVGGERSNGSPTGDVWELSLGASPTWRPIAPAGTPPPARAGHGGALVGRRIIIFTGLGASTTPLDDVWALDLAGAPAWVELRPDARPPARTHAMSAYDAAQNQFLMFGGGTGSFEPSHTDTWKLMLDGEPTWHRVSPISVSPPGRFSAGAVFDPVRRRMIYYGGQAHTGADSSQFWSFSPDRDQWEMLWPPAESAPHGSVGHSAIYDRDRMILFGGTAGAGFSSAVWVLALSDPPIWKELALPAGAMTPPPRFHPSTAWDPDGQRLFVFGGFPSYGRRLHDAWVLHMACGAS